MELNELILKLNKGNQNRYGEIEYEYSLEERLRLLDQILKHSNFINLIGHSKSEFQSAIYWGLCGSISQIENFLILLMPKYHEKLVEEGILMHFNKALVLHHRINFADYLLSTLEKLKLPHNAWKEEIQSRIKSWMEEEKDEHLIKKLHYLASRFKA